MENLTEKAILKINNFHRDEKSAVEYFQTILESLKFPVPGPKSYDQDIVVKLKEENFSFNPSKIINEIKETGAAGSIQSILDSKDRYLAPTIDIGILAMPPSVSAKISVGTASLKQSIRAPGVIKNSGNMLVDEILNYRKSICQNSSTEKFSMCMQLYRSYLQSCISLIDWFLNQYANYVKLTIPNSNDFDNIQTLTSRLSVEKRIDA